MMGVLTILAKVAGITAVVVLLEKAFAYLSKAASFATDWINCRKSHPILIALSELRPDRAFVSQQVHRLFLAWSQRGILE